MEDLIDINEYITKSLDERKNHLDLSTPCVETNVKWNKNNKINLASFLKTTLPHGRILVCHACNNPKCGNIYHLYFGTDKENIVIDGLHFGTFLNVWERQKLKYSEKEISDQKRRGDKSKGGKANKNISKSDEHKNKISEGLKLYWKNKKLMPL